MKYCLTSLSVYLMVLTSCNNKPLKFQQFYPYNKMTDTFYDEVRKKLRVSKDEYFLISNYADKKIKNQQIDSFVNRHITADLLHNTIYRIYFYRETNRTNLEKISENPRELDRYSNTHDLVFIYAWSDGKFERKTKIIDGEEVRNSGEKKLHFDIELRSDSTKHEKE